MRGFDRPSIAMGTSDSYDARKRVASVSLETGMDQQKKIIKHRKKRREKGKAGMWEEEVDRWVEVHRCK